MPTFILKGMHDLSVWYGEALRYAYSHTHLQETCPEPGADLGGFLRFPETSQLKIKIL